MSTALITRLASWNLGYSYQLQQLRMVHIKKIVPQLFPSLEERLRAMDKTLKDPELYKPVNIGLPQPKLSRREEVRKRMEHQKKMKENKELEKLSRKRLLNIPMEEVEATWEVTSGPHHLCNLAEHYGIFKDLFGLAYFVPRVPLKISFDYDEEMVTPVYAGNFIKPREAQLPPEVNYNSNEDTLWTLVLTNPDGHLVDNEAEYLHWFIGNIPGNKVSEGEVVCDYLRPLPPRGTGYHRFVFILYKQEKHVDFSSLKRDLPCHSLEQRTFKTYDFYRDFQDELTPAGIAFFQSDWDSSLKEFFHGTLKMREPSFEFEFPEPYLAPQKFFPKKRFFQMYLDMHRDPKEIQKEILLKRLKKIHPFQKEPELLPFPAAVPLPVDMPRWMKIEARKERVGIGKYRNLFRGNHRPRDEDRTL
ncbi:mitochondrial ribosomal protein L38 [Oratosquilla oratoria]|uniref:mitochondrial ribosomal protein L38 n=1 Tax=Oratosquilla oratoria TaxID=337810 RepID=UPI003F76FC46